MDKKDDSYWTAPPLNREDEFSKGIPLDDIIGEDDPVRRLAQIIEAVDWSDWEKAYSLKRGQPPIHPLYLGGILIWGMINGLRTSRQLERACKLNADYKWLALGFEPDHSTICKFRKKWDSELKEMLSCLCRMGQKHATTETISIGTDGTQIRSNSNRHGARTASHLEQKLIQLNQNFEKQLEEMMILDALDQHDQLGRVELQTALDRIERDKRKVRQALDVAIERDAIKRRSEGKSASPVRVPVTDPDSSILKNKDGGWAPNYMVIGTVNSDTGMVTDAQVLDGGNEASVVPSTVDAAQKIYGRKPDEIMFDGNFPTGENLELLNKQGIRVLAPMSVPADNPATRSDLNQPVPADQWDRLPIRAKKLDRAAFVFDELSNSYYCPMGRKLPYYHTTKRKNKRGDKTIKVREYKSLNCEDCPLAPKCLSKKAKQRSISRDEYEPLREDLCKKMQSEEAKSAYAKRAPVCEGLFAHIKSRMNVRTFLMRGRSNVSKEWHWTCIAYNVQKLMNYAK